MAGHKKYIEFEYHTTIRVSEEDVAEFLDEEPDEEGNYREFSYDEFESTANYLFDNEYCEYTLYEVRSY